MSPRVSACGHGKMGVRQGRAASGLRDDQRGAVGLGRCEKRRARRGCSCEKLSDDSMAVLSARETSGKTTPTSILRCDPVRHQSRPAATRCSLPAKSEQQGVLRHLGRSG